MADEHKQQAALLVGRVESTLATTALATGGSNSDWNHLRVALAQVHATLHVADKMAELIEALKDSAERP